LSPYLFVLAIEGLSLLLKELVVSSSLFSFHLRCSLIKLTHLFSAPSVDFVKAVKDVLGKFETLSGLKAYPSKSSVFLVGSSQAEKQKLL